MFTYSGWDGDTDSTTYYDVVFTEDVGVFKEGEKVETIFLTTHPRDIGKYALESYHKDGTDHKKQLLKLTPIAE